MTKFSATFDSSHFLADNDVPRTRPDGGLFLSRDEPAGATNESTQVLGGGRFDAIRRAISRVFVDPPAEDLQDLKRLVKDERFQGEVADPEFVDEPGLDARYRVYLFNRHHRDNRPLVACLGWGALASNRAGQTYLAAYARLMQRPIVTIDPLGYGGSSQQHSGRKWSFRDLAESNAVALRRIGVDEMDIAGSSWGGVIASLLAVAKQEKAGTLVTVAAPGIGRSLGQLKRTAVLGEAWNFNRTDKTSKATGEFQGEPDPNELMSLRNAGSTLRYLRELLRINLGELPQLLSPETMWVDVVGSRDGFTTVGGHLEAAQAREQMAPGKTTVHVIDGARHFGSLERRNVARVVHEALASV